MHESRFRNSARGLHPRPFLLDLLALTLILVSPLVVLLNYHGYRYLAPEVLLLSALAFGAAAVLALLIGLTGQLTRTVLFALLLALFIDVQSGLQPQSSVQITLLFAALVAALSALLWLLRGHASSIVSVIFATLIALTLLTAKSGSHSITSERGPANTRSGDTPLLIHLILDEHIGVEGLPLEISGARQLRSDLIDFYTSRGFRLFGGAYSEYANTYNAIANLVNFTSRDVGHPYLVHSASEREWNLKEAAYFQQLQRRGYQLHVYQSSYMDLCHADGVDPQDCVTYPVTSIATIQGMKLRPSEKARFIFNALLTRSRALRLLNKTYERRVRATFARVGWQLPIWPWEPPSFGPLRVPEVFERLIGDIAANPQGHAFFAHLILPHYPYVFDRQCALRPQTADWLLNRAGSPDALTYNTADSRARRYERYFDQVRCVLTLLDQLVSTLDSRGLLDDATIIVNGDHGSRIPAHFPSGTTLASGVVVEADYVDTFSTLYAARAPGAPPAYVADPASIVKLLRHHLRGEPLGQEVSCKVFLTAAKAGRALVAVEPKFCARGAVATFSGENH